MFRSRFPRPVDLQLRPHVPQRRCAAPIDATVIALWLGHEPVETTQICVHADLATKELALARAAPVKGKAGR